MSDLLTPPQDLCLTWMPREKESIRIQQKLQWNTKTEWKKAKQSFSLRGKLCVCMKQNNITKPTSPVESKMHRSTKQCQRKQKTGVSSTVIKKKSLFVWIRTIQFLTHLPNRISFRLEHIRLRTQLHKLHFLPTIPSEIPQKYQHKPTQKPLRKTSKRHCEAFNA